MIQTMLVAMQQGIVDFAAPPDIRFDTVDDENKTLSIRDFVYDLNLTALCSTVRMRDARFFNFSVAGLIVVFVLG